MSFVDASVLLSAALAGIWAVGSTRPQSDANSGVLPSNAADLLWCFVMFIKDQTSVLPAMLVLCAAGSRDALLQNLLSFGLAGSGEWLGEGEMDTFRSFALLLAVGVWRAEQMDGLIQRMLRSLHVIKVVGLGETVSRACRDPLAQLWPGLWGCGRRAACVAISSFGFVPFVKAALPSVVMDDLFYVLLGKAQDIWSRQVCDVPPWIALVVFPLVDLVHLIPVLSRIFLLAAFEYPFYGGVGDVQPFWLSLSAFAWTGHNCHVLRTSLLRDVPDNARQLWVARLS